MNQKERVLQLVSWFTGKPLQEIKMNSHLKNDLEMDSIDQIDLVLKLENFFGIYLSANQTDKLETVNDLHHCFK